MNKHIIVKTDASINPSKGVGLGYKAIVYNNNGENKEINGSHYIPHKIKTTKAEFIASTFAVKELLGEFGNDSSDYRLIIETDCEKTVKLFNENSNKTRLQRTMDILADRFDSPTVRWISRDNNTTADAIARSTLQTGWEESRQT